MWRVALAPKEADGRTSLSNVSARGFDPRPLPPTSLIARVRPPHHEWSCATADGEAERSSRGLARRRCGTDFTARWEKLGIEVRSPPDAQEVPDPIPVPDDTTHAAYDPGLGDRFLARPEPSWRRCSRSKPRRYQEVSAGAFLLGNSDLAFTSSLLGGACTPPAGTGLSTAWRTTTSVSTAGARANSSYPKPAFSAYAYPTPDGIDTKGADLVFALPSCTPTLGGFHPRLLAGSSPAAPTHREEKLRSFFDAAYPPSPPQPLGRARLTQ